MFEWICNRTLPTAILAAAMAATLAIRGAFSETSPSCCQPPAGAVGPDVIVGDIDASAQSYGSVGTVSAFTIGTNSCNVGTEPLDWVRNTAQHPVIAQNLYQIKDGRIKQLTLSWLKHGFFATNQNLCGTCQVPAGPFGTKLGVHCSDLYSANLNGDQANLGPRSQVNPVTGVFPFPPRPLQANANLLAGRLQIENADIDPTNNPDAVYVAEAQYIHAQDAAAHNGNNNASHRLVTFAKQGNKFVLSVANGPTVRSEPAINAWKVKHPDVQLFEVDVENDGRFILGIRSTRAGGRLHHEVALHNLNSDLAAQSLTLSSSGGTVSNPGFHGIKYHDEPDYSDTDWDASANGAAMKWSTTKFDPDQKSNALRWGTLYSFWFDSDQPVTKAVVGLYKPATPTEMTVDLTTRPPLAAVAARWATDRAEADRELGENRSFRLDARANVDREIVAIDSSLPGLKATAKKTKDQAKGVVSWDVSLELPAELPGPYYEALLRFKTNAESDPPLTVRVHGTKSKK